MPTTESLADETMPENVAVIVACQGSPRCDLVGPPRLAAQLAGCAWCKRVAMHADGSETVVEPGNA